MPRPSSTALTIDANVVGEAVPGHGVELRAGDGAAGPIAPPHDDAHPFSIRIERDLELQRLPVILRSDARLHRRHRQRALRGIADHLPANAVASRLHRGVVAPCGDRQ